MQVHEGQVDDTWLGGVCKGKSGVEARGVEEGEA